MLSTLKRDFFAHVPLSLSQAEVACAAEAFLRFLDVVPDREKRKVHFTSRFYRGSATGYCDTRGRSGKDEKEYFHWSPDIRDHDAYHALYRDYRDARRFFKKASRIYRKASEAAARTFREEPLATFSNRSFDAHGNVINGHLRFLCYTPSSGPFRAGGHYDKGHGTLAIAESGPGLRIGCCEAHILPSVRHPPGTATFMPGQLLWEDSNRRIIPAWHDVVPEASAPNISARCARWAVVFFINDKDGRYPEHEAVHKSLPVHEALAA